MHQRQNLRHPIAEPTCHRHRRPIEAASAAAAAAAAADSGSDCGESEDRFATKALLRV